jgi:hypothetical protein
LEIWVLNFILIGIFAFFIGSWLLLRPREEDFDAAEKMIENGEEFLQVLRDEGEYTLRDLSRMRPGKRRRIIKLMEFNPDEIDRFIEFAERYPQYKQVTRTIKMSWFGYRRTRQSIRRRESFGGRGFFKW